jgi:solute carrier family 35 protein E1
MLFANSRILLVHHQYNEVAFLALDSVHPVTHAVGNTIKRVVIIVSSVIVFRTQMSPLSIVGSSIAIAGTLLYSLVKQAYDKKDKK